MLVYCDASALLKLVVEEEESAPLRSYLAAAPELLTSELARVEVLRAVRRGGQRADETLALALLDAIPMARLEGEILDRASRLLPATLRTLDALHLATALTLAPPPAAFLCYDQRLATAARDHGFDVVAPGRDAVHER